MFVAKANPASAPLPASCGAPGRGRRRGVQLQPPPAPRGNAIAGVRMACALRARAKRLGLGDFASQYSLAPNPFSLSPSSKLDQLNALRIPTDVAGTSALNAAVWAAMHPAPAAPKLTPGQQALVDKYRREGQAGYDISMGLKNFDSSQLAKGVTELPGSVSAQVRDNAPALVPQICIFGKNADGSCKGVPWWLWAAGGGIAILLIAAAVHR